MPTHIKLDRLFLGLWDFHIHLQYPCGLCNKILKQFVRIIHFVELKSCVHVSKFPDNVNGFIFVLELLILTLLTLGKS